MGDHVHELPGAGAESDPRGGNRIAAVTGVAAVQPSSMCDGTHKILLYLQIWARPGYRREQKIKNHSLGPRGTQCMASNVGLASLRWNGNYGTCMSSTERHIHRPDPQLCHIFGCTLTPHMRWND